jgi:predicted small secreted protein
MKKTVAIAVLFCCAFLTPGCKTTIPSGEDINTYIAAHKSSIANLIKMGAEVGTENGLKAWAKKDPAAAKEAALALSKNVSDQILPYFKDGSQLLTADEVQELLDSSLFDKVPDPVKVAVIAASAVLDYYLPIPDSGTYLTQDQKDLVAAFLEGVRDGCDDFTTPNTRAIKKAVSVNNLPAPPAGGKRGWVGNGTGKKVLAKQVPAKPAK